MSNFTSVVTKAGRIGAGGAIQKAKGKANAKQPRLEITDVFNDLKAKVPARSEQIQCFITLYCYFMGVYSKNIYTRNSRSLNYNRKMKETNLVNTAEAFESGSPYKMTEIKAKCCEYLKSYRNDLNFFTPPVISEMLAFVDDSIQMIIDDISTPVMFINTSIRQLMNTNKVEKIPKPSSLLNHAALEAFLQKQN